jgi:ribosomal protein S27AE
MGIYDEWKKDIEEKLKKYSKDEELKETIPAVVKRCPKCHESSLEFDPKTGRIFCTRCGFEEYLKQIR